MLGLPSKKPWSVPAFAQAGTRAAEPPRPEAEDFPKHTSRVLGGGLSGEVRGGRALLLPGPPCRVEKNLVK